MTLIKININKMCLDSKNTPNSIELIYKHKIKIFKYTMKSLHGHTNFYKSLYI